MTPPGGQAKSETSANPATGLFIAAAALALVVATARGGEVGHRVCGIVGGIDDCLEPRANILVTLQPGTLSERTDQDGRVCFDAVADGDYVLRVTPYCFSELECWADVQATVAGADTEVRICPTRCDQTELHVVPSEGPPGAEVEVAGWCRCVHSGGSAPLYFDTTEIGEVRGDTGGCYLTLFRVPLVATAGSHEIAVPLAFGGDASASFRVPGLPDGCPGDCNLDDSVRIDELALGVGIALGERPLEDCPALDRGHDGAASVDDLVMAVGSALRGCPALLAPVSLEASYDAVATFDTSGEYGGLGTVREAGDGSMSLAIEFSLLDSIQVSGPLAADRTALLQGFRIQAGDLGSPASGDALVDIGDSGQRIDGTLATADVFTGPETVVYQLHRPAAGTPPELGGRYHVVLDHGAVVSSGQSALELFIEVPERGIGTCMGGGHFDDHGAVLPNLQMGTCLLTPEGRFSFKTAYVDPLAPESYSPRISFFGRFTSSPEGEVGSGFFQIGLVPIIIDSGSWTATRQHL